MSDLTERARLEQIKDDLQRRLPAVDMDSRVAREHYLLAMMVAQAAWDYVNPPDARDSLRANNERFHVLMRAVHELRRFELNLVPSHWPIGSPPAQEWSPEVEETR